MSMFDYYYDDDSIENCVRDLHKIAKKIEKTEKKKRKKYSWKNEVECDATYVECCVYDDEVLLPCQEPQESSPDQLLLNADASGFFFGLPKQGNADHFVGIPFGSEGHIAVVGGEGSGKSAGIIKPTLRTWGGAICATDIKGELSDFYAELYEQGVVSRPFIVFDPIKEDSAGYDPFAFLMQDGENGLITNLTELVHSIIPHPPGEKDRFWVESERSILTAGLLYYYRKGLNFSEAVLAIVDQSVSELCNKMLSKKSNETKRLLGEIRVIKDEALASIDLGLRNHLKPFFSDSYISNAFRGKNKDSNCFSWDDLDTHNIFLRIPEGRLEQWSGAIRLMINQLIRHLERRPDKHSTDSTNTIQALLLLDEFARFGQMEDIANSLATLRSKRINICLVLQSLAQLDKFYGADDRRVILDNCRYMAILRADDPDTQEMLCRRIGTHLTLQRSFSEHMDDDRDTTGYSRGVSEIREFIVQPHELAYLEDILVLGFGGLTRVEKCLIHESRIPQWERRRCINARILNADEETALNGSGIPIVRATAVRIIRKEE